MELNLKRERVIVTGGSRGIGWAALELFAAEGADVAFFSRNADQVAEAVLSLERSGGRVLASAFEIKEQNSYAA